MIQWSSDRFPTVPGVYQMSGEDGQVLYVGKARNLRNRLQSYFRASGLPVKTAVLMKQVHDIKTIITASDTEALLLEANLIKNYRPRYNVLLRDDKSYPYLYLSDQEAFPRLDFYRGPRKKQGRCFGPYPTVGAVRDNLAMLQKLFRVRQCSDVFFRHRSRPCLQYEIKRCTAPCVGLVSQEAYAKQVEHVILFLEGKNNEIISEIQHQMDQASCVRDYEQAAYYRDQLVQLRKLQETQCVSGEYENVDVIGVALAEQAVAVSVVFIRNGLMIGHRMYFPEMGIAENINEVLMAFIPQYYLSEYRQHDLPDKIILADKLLERVLLQEFLTAEVKKTLVITDFRGALFKPWQHMAKTNAQHGLQVHLTEKASAVEKISALQQALAIQTPIERIECFDVSHTQGESTVASCVVYDKEGLNRKAYRRFNIHGVSAGDDYAALAQALLRRYKKMKMEGSDLPDLVLIDGGQGQLNKAINVFEELQLTAIQLLAISKGPARKAGQEQLWLPLRDRALHLESDSAALHLLQLIRDEAHRFAITFHRQKRAATRTYSKLEDIPAIGAKRRRELLRYFGGLQELRDASVVEIAKVPGISAVLAQQIYEFLH